MKKYRVFCILLSLALLLSATAYAAESDVDVSSSATTSTSESSSDISSSATMQITEDSNDASSPIDFEPSITNQMDNSKKEWFNSSLNRATLTWSLCFDLFPSHKELTIDPLGTIMNSYVGSYDLSIVIMIPLEEENSWINIFYTPLLGTASYWILEDTSMWVLEKTLDETTTSYYQNDAEDMMTVFQEIQSAFE